MLGECAGKLVHEKYLALKTSQPYTRIPSAHSFSTIVIYVLRPHSFFAIFFFHWHPVAYPVACFRFHRLAAASAPKARQHPATALRYRYSRRQSAWDSTASERQTRNRRARTTSGGGGERERKRSRTHFKKKEMPRENVASKLLPQQAVAIRSAGATEASGPVPR